MNNMLHMSLIGSASSLGTNWIYDRELMNQFTRLKKASFLPIQHDLYEKAKNGFNVYPLHILGDLDFMGEVMYIYNKYLQTNRDTPLKQYFYDHFGPKSKYTGYIEQYGKELINNIDDGNVFTNHIDKQLIGPSMFIVGYANNLSNEEINQDIKVLTNYENIPKFNKALEYLFTNLKPSNKEKALNDSISFLPVEYQKSCLKALTDIELFTFIDEYAGIACGLEQAFPLIYYIINNTTSFEEALHLNAKLSGASCARGILIGAIYSVIEELPGKYLSFLNYN